MAKRIPKLLNPSGYKYMQWSSTYDITSMDITSKNVVDVLLHIEPKDLTMSTMFKLFGDFHGKNACHPYDLLEIPVNTYGVKWKTPNKNKFITTAGLWVFNKYFIEENKEIFDIYHYINKEYNKKMNKKFESELGDYLMIDKISTKTMTSFLMKLQEWMKYETFLAPSHSEAMLTCTSKINPYKKKLIAKYKKEIEAGDAFIYDKIEKELLDYAKKILDDDIAMDMYKSGALGDWGNNFKNIYVSKGAVQNPDPDAKQKYNIITGNYLDGIQSNEYANLANSLAAGPYARGKKTADGGYMENLFISGLQHLILDEEGSDCGTTRTITVTLTNKNFRGWMYNYMVQGSKLVELTIENKDKYIGKTVKFRFSSLCEGKKICSKCAGNMWYRLGIKNVGVMTAQLPARLKLCSMKNFHDTTATFHEIDINEAFNS